MDEKQVDRILLNFLFSEDANVFDEILCSDKAYALLSDENVVMIITKKMEETDN